MSTDELKKKEIQGHDDTGIKHLRWSVSATRCIWCNVSNLFYMM